MNPWRWVDPRVGSVRVADVQAYLLGRGWKLRTSPNPNMLIFEAPVGDDEKPLVQALPSAESFSDYHQRITEFITALSEIENRHPVELLEAILRHSSTDRDTPGTPSDGVHSGAEAVRNKKRRRA